MFLAKKRNCLMAIAALQIDFADSFAVPLVLLADHVLGTPSVQTTLRCLKKVADNGVQVLLLAGNRQLVNQLVEADLPCVRLSLQEHNDQAMKALAARPQTPTESMNRAA